MTTKAASVYEKLSNARTAFHNKELKKTGLNKFHKYPYFELGDFLVPANECLHQAGLLPVVSFGIEYATLTIYEFDGNGTITFTSPMAEANLTGSHPIQNMGAVETYQRRYLYMTAMEVVEHDAIDCSEGAAEPTAAAPKQTKASPKVTPIKKQEEASAPLGDSEITDAEEAEKFAGGLIQKAKEMKFSTQKELMDFWKKNKAITAYLKKEFPPQYEILVSAFADLKSSIKE